MSTIFMLRNMYGDDKVKFIGRAEPFDKQVEPAIVKRKQPKEIV